MDAAAYGDSHSAFCEGRGSARPPRRAPVPARRAVHPEGERVGGGIGKVLRAEQSCQLKLCLQKSCNSSTERLKPPARAEPGGGGLSGRKRMSGGQVTWKTAESYCTLRLHDGAHESRSMLYHRAELGMRVRTIAEGGVCVLLC